jgi:hypothetical protein
MYTDIDKLKEKTRMKQKKQFIIAAILLLLIFVTWYMSNNHVEDSKQGQTYSLRTNFNEYKNEELSVSLFNEIISGFRPDVWDFMVLSPNKPIKDSTFIQVGAPDEIVHFQFTLEIGFENPKSGLQMYRLYTKDKDVVLQYFVDYWQNRIIPDISLWEDVSEEMRR